MSKISRFQVPVAHNMFQKIHSTDYNNNSKGVSSSLPSISASKLQDQQQQQQQQQQPQQPQRRQQQKRLSRVSSNSFLLRLLSIEERHEQKKYDRVRNGRVGNMDRQTAEEEGRGVKGNSFHQNSKINQDKNMIWTRDTNTVPRQRGSESRLPSLSNDHQGTHDSSSTSDVHKSLPTMPSNQVNNNNNQPDQHQSSNSNIYDASSSFSTPYDHNPNAASDSFDLTDFTDARRKPLRLAPLLLPPVHSVRPRPLKHRDFLSPTTIRGPINDKEWEELIECRYIRHATPRYALKWTPSRSYIR